MEFNKKINIVFDVDEILTCISPVWVSIMFKNRDYFGKYLNLPENFDLVRDFDEILKRKYFYLELSYGKNCLTDGSISEKELLDFKKNYFSIIDNDDFYTKLCKPTKLFRAMKQLMMSNWISNAYIVSRCLPHNKQGKLDFLEMNLGKDLFSKVKIHLLDLDEKKSDYVKSLEKVDVIFDDEISNVIDIMRNAPMKDNGTDIYIPLYGYNLPNTEVFDLTESSGYRIQYYEAIKGLNASTYTKVLGIDGEMMEG